MEIIPQLVANSIIAGSIYALVGIGFTLIYGAVRFFDLGYGVMTAIGGYAVFFLANTLGVPIIPAIILGVLVAGFFGLLANLIVYRPIRKRGASNLVLLVASLGVLTMLQAIIAIFFTSQFQTFSQSVGTQHVFNILGGSVTDIQVLILVATIVVMGALVLTLKKTKFGRAIEAISDDEEVAKTIGINTDKIINYVFFIGSAIAGLAGILVGFDTGIEPTMGLALLLKGVIAAIIGGIGNIYGAVLGAFLLGFVENFGIWQISGEWKDAIAFVLLTIFLIFRPQGILPK